MAFKQSAADALLIACHRRCCICHRFCGFKMELHHIEQRSKSKNDSIDNAIPLCFECHAEVQLYNDDHPRGRKYHPKELLGHKQQWLAICKESPGMLLMPMRPIDVGPIQSLIDELEFNIEIAGRTGDDTIGALFLVAQFHRAIQEGVVSLLSDDVKKPISNAYATMMRANSYLQKMAMLGWGPHGSPWSQAREYALKAMACAKQETPVALTALLAHLGHSDDKA